jgi:hypothetical protein
VHALQGDLRGRVGSHVPRPERAFTQHLHARREQTGKIEHICKKIIKKMLQKSRIIREKICIILKCISQLKGKFLEFVEKIH